MPLLRSRGLLLLLFGIGAACARPPTVAPPEVEYAGCQAVLEPGPVCVLAAQRVLRLWVGLPREARIEVRAGDFLFAGAGKPVQDGRRFTLRIPPRAKRLDVLVKALESQATWSLRLAEPAAENPRRPLARRRKSRDLIREVAETAWPLYNFIQDRRFTAARAKLAGLRAGAKTPAEFRYHVAYNQGLLAEKEGDYRSAMTEIQKAVEIAERVKKDGYQWQAEQKMALLLCGVGRCRESAELFERLSRTPQATNACEEGQFLINQGWSALLARETGESFGDLAPLIERALATYETCKHAEAEQRANVLINLALAHLQEERLRQTKATLARARELEPHPPLLQRLWWLDLEGRIALLERRPVDALRRFGELGELAAETGSFDGRLRASFGQARAHIALADGAAAIEVLRRAEDLLDEQSLQVPVHEGRVTFVATRQALVILHVELLLNQGRTAEAFNVARHARSRVLRQLAHADRLASLAPKRRAQWAALITAYQERRVALEARAKDDWKLPADQHRHEQASRMAEAEAAKKLLDRAFLLLEEPRKRPEEDRPFLRPGELVLAYHPLSHGWVGFAANGKTVEAHRFELPAGVPFRREELARRLLLTFRSAIQQAQRIRVLPSGALQSVDFHALPFAQDVLLASVPVVYGLDLPSAARTTQASGQHCLLVADPRNDLPGALAETRTVRRVLKSWSRPWTTEELESAEASAEVVGRRLASADLLHYAGHGTFSGFGGWESSLLLGQETQLTPGDLLALDRVPAWVVLSACDTGRSTAASPVASIGLAHAFLLAGSRSVIASTRPAEDRTVPAFFAELYRYWEREPDLAVALQRAQLAWRKRSSKADWASFRLFEP